MGSQPEFLILVQATDVDTVNMRAKMDGTISTNIITRSMAELTRMEIATTDETGFGHLSGSDGQRYEIQGSIELGFCAEDGAETYTETFCVVQSAPCDVILGATSKYPRDHSARTLRAIRLKKQTKNEKLQQEQRNKIRKADRKREEEKIAVEEAKQRALQQQHAVVTRCPESG